MDISKRIVSILLILLLITVSLPILGTQSVEAQLIGVSYDQGLDTDSDGAFDFLVVGVAINVASTGYYEVQISGLQDSYGSYISVSGSNSSYLSAGEQVLNVSLNGEYIYESGLNASYVSYMSLYGGPYPWDRFYYGSLSNVPLKREYLYTEFDPPHAKLTGEIIDQGVDSDGDGGFNFLEIGAEVNVSKAGYYSISISGLQDSYGSWIDVRNSSGSYLEVGFWFLNVSLSGYRIRSSHLNPRYVNSISLYNGYGDYIHQVELSQEYVYTDFDAPAVLTGVISDKGVDTDGDGMFNFLEIGVQVDVSDAGTYEVSVSGLLDSGLNFTIAAYASQSVYLDVGLGFVNFALDGTQIYLSNRNPKYIGYVSLNFWGQQWDVYFHDEIKQVALSRQYSYTEFDPPAAMLTGKIFDLGVDNDADGFFDFLQIGVELNVTEAGTFWVSAWGLLSTPQEEDYWPYTIDVWDYKKADLDVGIRVVNLYMYGPRIYASRHDPANVSSIYLTDDKGYYQSLYDVPLSKVYSYAEFDAPFWDVETKVVVYPDGRVALEGSLMHSHMTPKNTGPTATGFFNLIGSEGNAQAQAGLEVKFPQELASQFPFNSTTANMLATYSDGILNLGVNSTLVLPPGDLGQYPYYPYGQWPFNATDGTMALAYSGGVLNLEINGETTFPSVVKSQFPFNSTDLIVVGDFSANMLDGTITFSVLDDFTFDDVDVDFTGNRTGLTINGTVTVVFGVPFGGFLIKDSTDLEQQIDALGSTILGESGIVWNVTNGLLNVTDFDADYSLLDSWGAKVTFEVKAHGDFVKGLAYLLCQGRNADLLDPILDEAYKSVKDGSILVDYKHDSGKAAVKLTFAYDLKRLVDTALTPPLGTLTYVVTSSSMYPTLTQGDLVFVEPVENASDILADPKSGDIIAFYRPDSRPYYPEVIIHRAINKSQTFGNGTWYFQTQGDWNWSPDSWTVPEHLIIGKVVRRVPLLGFLLAPNLWSYYWYSWNAAIPLQLGNIAFSSLQEASVNLSYFSNERQVDFKLKVVDKLKALVDNVTRTLPESWPPQTPPEVKEFFEKLLNTTYASVSSAQISSSYANGVADFRATVNIEGDLNKEINYVKDLYLQFLRISYSRSPYDTTIPWQLDFIDQTKLDVSNLRVSAQLGETLFEGKVQGVIITPPRDTINATHFTLGQLFNLTAPQYSWQQEFPAENQRLRITVEGGSNATHMVTLYRPPSVPDPNTVGPYQKSMTWFNQTFSSLKDLIFKIGPRLRGTLTIKTTPVTGEVFVNDESWGSATQSGVVDVGFYDITFGDVTGYRTPAPQLAMVYADQETIVTGVYVRINGTLTITTTPVSGEVIVEGVSWGKAPQSRVVQIGTYTISFGAREGYTTPDSQVATVSENTETSIEGIYQAIPGTVVAEITEPELVSVANPFIVNATKDTATYLVISEISHPITVVVKNITELEGVQPPPGTWKFLGNCVQITVNNTDITVNATIRMYYTLAQLEASGLDESTLKIHYWDATSNEWVPFESHVNKDEHYVWAIISHFSIWAIMGQLPAPTTSFWFLIIGVALIAVIIAMVAIYARRRKTTKAL